MRRILPSRSRTLTGWLCALAVGACAGCGSEPSPGEVRFQIHATPPPDDVALSPLTDLRVSTLELRDATSDAILARSNFDPTQAGTSSASSLDVGMIGVSPTPRDLRLLALGSAGQQVLGLGLYRGASWSYGDSKQIVLELRRPLFFFGGSPQLTAPNQPTDLIFAPNKQLFPSLQDETKLRVIDPNSVNPLLAKYDLQFDGLNQPVSAAAGTFDGQSILAASMTGTLYVVDTLQLQNTGSLALGSSLPAQSIVVDPMDRTATVLGYQRPPATTGRSGTVSFVRDLPALRRNSGDPQLLTVDVDANATTPPGVPLSAAYAPDGLVDVVIALPPIQLGQTGQPDCTTLGSGNHAILRRYDPTNGQIMSDLPLPYTTAISYTEAGERVLAQPCTKVSTAVRPGQVVISKLDGSIPDRVLSAPGTADLAVLRNSIISIGSQDVADDPKLKMKATLRTLEANASVFATSPDGFDLPAWQVPYRVSSTTAPAIDILFYPTDIMAYGISVTPDRARALVLLRATHQTSGSGLFVDTYTSGTISESCFMQWAGYTYHVLLINLQNGSLERDYLVGVQNKTCSSAWRCNPGSSSCPDAGRACFVSCDPTDSNPYLIGFKDGYVPGAASVLFGRR